jgi:CRP-like cAMP-binding protein
MVAIKTLQLFPIFTNFSEGQLSKLVNVAREDTVVKGGYICEIGKKLDHFYLISSGEVEVFFEVPKIHVDYESFGQPSHLKKEKVIIGQIGPGDICGWSGLVPPHISTSSVRTLTRTSIIAFQSEELLKYFEDDCRLGSFLLVAAAQAIGKRLQAIYQRSAQLKSTEVLK